MIISRSVELFTSPDLRLFCVIRLHQKLVNCVRWHPLYTAASPTMSPCRHWISTGSNENTVYVVDLTHIIGKRQTNDNLNFVWWLFLTLACQLKKKNDSEWKYHFNIRSGYGYLIICVTLSLPYCPLVHPSCYFLGKKAWLMQKFAKFRCHANYLWLACHLMSDIFLIVILNRKYWLSHLKLSSFI